MTQFLFVPPGGGGVDPLLSFVTVSSSPFPVLLSYDVLLVDTGAARTLVLPAPATCNGKLWRIKDIVGSAEANAITLDRTAGGNIEGVAANRELRTNFGEWDLACDGTNFWLLASK